MLWKARRHQSEHGADSGAIPRDLSWISRPFINRFSVLWFPLPIAAPKIATASFLVLEQPEVSFFWGSIAPGWFVSQPLRVLIERDEAGDYVVSDSELAVYGVGADRISAMADYKQSLIEYYEIIEEESRAHVPTAALFRHVGRFVTRSNR